MLAVEPTRASACASRFAMSTEPPIAPTPPAAVPAMPS